MGKKLNSKPEAAEPTFEQSLEWLQATVRRLEDGELSMEAALAAYEQGIGHLKRCYGLLEAAEQKVQLLAGIDAEGNPKVEEFPAAADDSPC